MISTKRNDTKRISSVHTNESFLLSFSLIFVYLFLSLSLFRFHERIIQITIGEKAGRIDAKTNESFLTPLPIFINRATKIHPSTPIICSVSLVLLGFIVNEWRARFPIRKFRARPSIEGVEGRNGRAEWRACVHLFYESNYE